MKRILSTLAGCVMACAAAQAQVVLITSAAPEGASYLKVDSRAEALQFEATAAQTAVGVTTNLNYSLTAADSWCTATRTATGFTVSVAANTGAAARTTTLRLNALDNNSHTYTVSQLGSEPAILVGAKTVTLEDNATHFTIDVKTNTEVTVACPDWIACSTAAINTSAVLSFDATLLEEEGTSRTGTITLTDKAGKADAVRIEVTQSFRGYPRFAVMSDTHFGNTKGEGPMYKVPNALKNILSKTPRVDAIFICGDLTDWGKPEQYQQFKQVFDDRSIVPEDVKVYVMMGNHDNYADGALQNYLVLNQPYHQLIDIKGYPFITTSMNGGSWDDYSAEEVQALDDNLARATREYPGKPIFVFTHVPPMNTVYGTCDGEGGWGSNILTPVLKKYPHAVIFGGHSHFPLGDPRSIHQGIFTTINDGSVTYSEIEPGTVDEGIHPAKYEYVTEACICSVDRDTTVEIQRWDTYGNEEMLPRWYVKAPHDGSQFVYTNARTGGTAPVWADTDKVTVSGVADGKCTVAFPQAADDENVHHYVIELVSEGKTVATHGLFSGYYLNSRMPKALSMTLQGVPDGKTLTARVKALDSYKNASAWLVSEPFTTQAYKPADDAVMPVADLFDVRFGKDGAAQDVSAHQVTVTKGSTTPTTHLNETYNRYAASFTGTGACHYRIDYAEDAAIKQAMQNGFSLEVMYKPNSTNNMCPLSAQESGGAGIEQASGGQIQFFCHVGGSYKTLKSSVTAKAGEYYHVVAVYDKDAAKVRMFVNGAPAGEMAASGAFGFPSATAAQWFAIGGDASKSTTAQYALDGEVCVARMYAHALTRDEAWLLFDDIKTANYTPDPSVVAPVASLFDVTFNEDGTATDVSANQTIISQGTTLPKVAMNDTYHRLSATFDGTTQCFYRIDYAEDDAIKQAMQNGFALETIYRTENLKDVCPLSAQESGGAGIEQATGGQLQFWCRVGGGYKTVKTNVTVETGRYYHVVAIYDKENAMCRVYVDGQPAGEVAAAGSFGFPPKTEAHWFCIGGDAHPSGAAQFCLTGEIVVARMYDHALSRDEAYRLYEKAEQSKQAAE